MAIKKIREGCRFVSYSAEMLLIVECAVRGFKRSEVACDGVTELRSTVKALAPELVLGAYRRLRRALRSIVRIFITVRTCRVRGVTVRIGVSSELEHYRAISYAVKEPETLDWLEKNLQDDDVFMDVGANIGLYSLYAARLRPKSKIYAFEPESGNFSRLCRNIFLNGVTNIIPCNCPLADRDAFDLFYVGDLEAGSALHSFGRLSDFRHGGDPVVLKQGALAATLDTLVGQFGLPQPTLLKIDVDGIEEKILDGGEKVLNSTQLRTILVEVTCQNGMKAAWPEQKLNRFGYALQRKSDWVEELNGMTSQNYIFSRQ